MYISSAAFSRLVNESLLCTSVGGYGSSVDGEDKGGGGGGDVPRCLTAWSGKAAAGCSLAAAAEAGGHQRREAGDGASTGGEGGAEHCSVCVCVVWLCVL